MNPMHKEQVEEIDRFLSRVEHVCARPSMWFGSTNYDAVSAFFMGYLDGSELINRSELNAGYKFLNNFIFIEYGCSRSIPFDAVIRQNTGNDVEAIQQLKRLLIEYFEKYKTMSPDEILIEKEKEIQSRKK